MADLGNITEFNNEDITMDLAYTDDELAFQDEVRSFIGQNLPAELAAKVKSGAHLEKEDIATWHDILYQKGWVAPGWPVEHGGKDWTLTQRHIFQSESARAWTPPLSPFGLAMVAPVIMNFGSDEQKAHYLPRILSGEDLWCQGYSEPGSGSDLASLRTKAEGQGDHYLVNGQKIWTTEAHWADMIFLLVRTDPDSKPQEGISFLLVDMKTPGITVRPIITIDGAHSLNEVFFEDVRVPKENRVGEEGMGWTYAKFLLGNERTGIAGVKRSKMRVERLKEIARTEPAGGGRLIEDASFRRRLAEVEMDLLALEYTELRGLSRENSGRGPGPESSLLKIKGTEIQQALTQLTYEAMGYQGLPYGLPETDPSANLPPIIPEHGGVTTGDHLYMRAASIYGGSNEIQRNIIAKAVLGL
ncbi:MAG: pimeloyl-CoA dehydrogenase large subunit [Rhodospirillaceae bacterium]|nr:pimeloyl-CoA dehydrogenase large subunit [Rhodospirillaceae bacterium]